MVSTVVSDEYGPALAENLVKGLRNIDNKAYN